MNNKLDYIAIDFETANQYRNSACSVGLVRFIDGKRSIPAILIHPAKMYFILEWTETIHHISYNDVRSKPYFPEIWDTMVMPFVNKTPGVPIEAHNRNTFDMPVIQSCCEYFGMEVQKLEYFDSLIIARKTWPEFESHQLTKLGERFNIEYIAHDALEDSRVCGQIIKIAAEKWDVNSVEDLLAVCKTQIKTF